MGLGVFISCFEDVEILDRLNWEGMGIFLIGDGVFHALEKGVEESSAIFEKDVDYYALSEDILSRGFSKDEVRSGVNLITYDELVDLIMGDYEKLVWF